MIKIRSKNLEATEINHFKINLPECFHTVMNSAGREREWERCKQVKFWAKCANFTQKHSLWNKYANCVSKLPNYCVKSFYKRIIICSCSIQYFFFITTQNNKIGKYSIYVWAWKSEYSNINYKQGPRHRRRIKKEEKAKVVTSVWREEFIHSIPCRAIAVFA